MALKLSKHQLVLLLGEIAHHSTGISLAILAPVFFLCTQPKANLASEEQGDSFQLLVTVRQFLGNGPQEEIGLDKLMTSSEPDGVLMVRKLALKFLVCHQPIYLSKISKTTSQLLNQTQRVKAQRPPQLKF